MSELTAFGSQALQVVLQLSLHATVIVFVVLLVQFALGRKISARWRYAMWGILVARLLIPWNYEVPVPGERLVTTSDGIVAKQAAIEVERGVGVPHSAESHTTFEVAPTPLETSPPIPESVATESPASRPAFALPNVGTLAAGIWLLGAVGFPCVILLSHVRMTLRLLHSSSAPPGWVMDTLEDVRKEFGSVVRPEVFVTSEIHSPTLLGASHPKIFLPSKLVEECSSDEMRLFLLHELSHLRSGDIWFSWLWCLALSIHWFNPLMWWTGTRIRKDRELACDELVLRQIGVDAKDDYAHALLRAVSHVSGKSTQRYQFGMVGIAESKSEITRRIESILAPIVRGKRLRAVGALTLAAILCVSFVQFVPVSRIVEAQESRSDQSENNAPVDVSAFIQAVDVRMRLIKERHARGDDYRDKSDLSRVYIDLKEQDPSRSDAELEEMIRGLSAYAEAHEDDEDYGWRIWHLKSMIARDTEDEIVLGDVPPSFTYLWEAILHYPYTKYSIPSKHSKFQHLVNELAMMVWDREGLDAAEKYFVDTWQSDRRLLHFADLPWERRLEEEGIPLERLGRLSERLIDKLPLKKLEFLLTASGLHYEGALLADFAALENLLLVIERPRDYYIAMGITTEDMLLAQFREARSNLMRLVTELNFDHFSDIGLQPLSDSGEALSQPQPSNSALLRASCANNLKQLALVMKMFAHESRGARFPRPDRLKLAREDIYPTFLRDPNILMCPADEEAPEAGMSEADMAQWYFDHSNYWYIAHAVIDEEQGLAYIEAYRKVVEEGDGNLDIDFVADSVHPGKILRTREGVERFFITDISNPAASALGQSEIPVLIERTDKHGPAGGNVLFMDGHVEYIKYPGRFPMTEAFIEGLRSLDALGSGR